MIYLTNIEESLGIDESNIEYIDIFNRPDLIYGTSLFVGDYLDFSKLSVRTKFELISNYGEEAKKECRALEKSSSGCRIRFTTESDIIIFKVELKREWDYKKINLWASSGFDVYTVKQDKYIHRTVFGPETGKKIFAESIKGGKNLCIFLPLYNEIKKMYIGIRQGCLLNTIPYHNKLPILFYGNSITQGAAASRSGNCFCNIVSRELDCDIINFSISSCCRGLLSAAESMGKINCRAIVVDYTRNAYDLRTFEKTYEDFYMELRKYHHDIPIILMTVSNFNGWRGYYGYDGVVENTYNNSLSRKENTFLLNQSKLIDEDDWDLYTIDGVHYTDLGMKAVADEICRILN